MTVAWIAPTIVVLAGGSLTSTAVRDLASGWASWRWPSTRARVLSTGYHVGTQRPRDTSAVVAYEYEVSGRRYESTRHSFSGSGGGYGSATRAVALGSRFTAGDVVLAYYDPRRPQQSCLQRGVGPWNFLMLIFGLLLLLPGVAWLVAVVS